jgi:predicted GTPase
LVATKADNPQSQKNFQDHFASLVELNPSVFFISSLTGEGIQEMLWKIKEGLVKGPSEEEQIIKMFRDGEA